MGGSVKKLVSAATLGLVDTDDLGMGTPEMEGGPNATTDEAAAESSQTERRKKRARKKAGGKASNIFAGKSEAGRKLL